VSWLGKGKGIQNTGIRNQTMQKPGKRELTNLPEGPHGETENTSPCRQKKSIYGDLEGERRGR